MDQKYKLSAMTVGLHWLIALAMIGMLAFGLIIDELPKGEFKSALMWWHKAFGVLVLFFAVWRLLWRAIQGFPEPLSEMEPWQAKIASAVHWLLLLGTVFMPISGIMTSLGKNRAIDVFGLFIIPAFGESHLLHEVGELIHKVGGKLLIIAVLLHVAGALKHQIIDRDGTMTRMAGRRVGSQSEA